MILQAAFGHIPIYQKPVIPFQAVSNKVDKIWMMKLTKMINFRLQPTVINRRTKPNIWTKGVLRHNKETHQPLLMTLKTFRFELLDSNDHSTSRPFSTKGMLINPPFIDITKSSFPQETVSTEVSSSILKLTKCEGFQIWGWQYVTFRSWSGESSRLVTMCWDWQIGRNKRVATSTSNFCDSCKSSVMIRDTKSRLQQKLKHI